MTVIGRLLELVDHRCFRGPDADAVLRGWTVRRDGLFRRTYRDPRFDELRVPEPSPEPAPAPARAATTWSVTR